MRRMSIPLKVFAAMALAVCALLVSFELTSGFAYGSSDSDGGGTKASASLTTASRSTVYDIGNGIGAFRPEDER